MPVEVRPLRPDEWPLLRELRLTALRTDPSAFWSTYDQEAGYADAQWQAMAQRAAWFTVQVDTGPAGLAACGDVHDEPDNPDRQVIGMWVAPAARRTGAGRALLAAVIEQARREGAPGIVLWVAVANAPARGLYDALGFVDTGRRGDLPHDPPVPEMEMRLPL